MRIRELTKLIRAEEKAGNPVFVEGSPGTGKSDVVRQMCEEDHKECVDVRLALMNPVDLRGIPVVRGDTVMWVPPVFLANKKNARFFLDEINAAPTTTQAAAYQWVLDRKIGEWEMDPSCTMVAAGNKATDRAVVYEMPSALRNRFAMYELDPDLSDWKDWALGRGKVPVIIPTFLSFFEKNAKANIGSKYGLLFHFEPKVHKRNFPTPRQWEKLGRLIQVDARYRFDVEAIAGHIGEGAAAEFCAFCRVADDLPNIDNILKGKGNAVAFPSRSKPDARYAFCGAIVGALLNVDDEKRVEATTNVAAYSVNALSNDAEFAVLMMKDFCRTPQFKKIYRPVLTTPEWKKWTELFGELMSV